MHGACGDIQMTHLGVRVAPGASSLYGQGELGGAAILEGVFAIEVGLPQIADFAVKTVAVELAGNAPEKHPRTDKQAPGH
jgi:hypothetical protein